MNKYKPAYSIYLILIVSAVFVRSTKLTSGLYYVDSIINDITIGIFTSTIVALLIDQSNCNMKNKEKENEIWRTYLMMNLQIVTSLQVYANTCQICFKDIDFSIQQHSWLEWFQICKKLIEKSNYENTNKAFEFLLSNWNMNTELIVKELDNILINQFILKSNNLMDDNKYFKIKEIKDMCNVYSNLFNSEKNLNDQFVYLDNWNQEIEKYLSTNSNFSNINQYLFAPFELYKHEKIVDELHQSNKKLRNSFKSYFSKRLKRMSK